MLSCYTLITLLLLLVAVLSSEGFRFQPSNLLSFCVPRIQRQPHGRRTPLFPPTKLVLLATGGGDGDGISKTLNLFRDGVKMYKELDSKVVEEDEEDEELRKEEETKNNATAASDNPISNTGNPSGDMATNASQIQNTTEALQNLVQDKLDAFNARTKRTRNIIVKKLAAWAYDVCSETRKDGNIDESALYAGTLLVHLHLSKYVGVAACQPPSRDQMDELFQLADQDRSGTLNEQEFTNAVIVATQPIALRVAIFWSLLTVLPIVVSYTMGGIDLLMRGKIQRLPPGILRKALSVVQWIIENVFSILFFSILVPNLFNRVDAASRRSARKKYAEQNQSTLWWLQPTKHSSLSAYFHRIGRSMYSMQDTMFGLSKKSDEKKESDEEPNPDKESDATKEPEDKKRPWYQAWFGGT